jgi:hypothetical protein
VQFASGRNTLCLLPAKFPKKLWVKVGTFLIVEDVEDADSRVTGQIVHVLYEEHVKQLKKMPGVWWVTPALVFFFPFSLWQNNTKDGKNTIAVPSIIEYHLFRLQASGV